VKLAAFLAAKVRGAAKPLPPRLQPITLFWRDKSHFWFENAEQTMIHWNQPPGLEPPGQRTADQTWADLRAWVERRPDEPVPYPQYVEFAKGGVVVLMGSSEKSRP
jgi:hypothetical protein